MSLIYYIILSLILIFSLLEFFNEEKIDRNIFFAIVILMALVAGLACAISPDWYAYFETYYYSLRVDWKDVEFWSEMSGMEKGYLRLNKLFTLFGFGFGMLTLFIASFSLYLKSTIFYKYGGFPLLVLFIYAMPNYLFEEHIHIRQGLANGFAIYSARYIIDRKLIKFLLCIVIGFQFHESIIVFVLAYWIAPMKFDEKVIGWLVIFAIIGFYTGLNSIIEVIMKFMPIGQDKFEDYQGDLYNSDGFAVGDFIKIISVMSIIVYNKYAKHDLLYCYFRNLFIMGVLLFFFLGKGIFGIRLPGFYLVFLGLTLGRMLYVFEGDRFKKIFVYSSFVFYTIVLIFWFQVKQGSDSGFNRYKTIFSNEAPYGLWI
ncbi:EpsG family protein [Chishuiella changwenlii]|uniref:EpsG family protein n=2 Tax=Chishuiella changwenlii TaxID=1434701 RepID=A0A1M6U1F2_9FLAO|nr:EpsG family protein [Chishuiella changwenlii]SHK62983.1 EpsG family protein [Chishuiella changwenlii]